MPNEGLDQLLKDCRAELAALISLLEPKRSRMPGTARTRQDVGNYEARVANLRKTIRQLEVWKTRKTSAA